MSGWAAGPLVAFDTETTGLDVNTDRIVTAYLGDGGDHDVNWLIDPGVAIPAAATAVHGITTEHARAKGRSASAAVAEVVGALVKVLAAGIPVVTYNVIYDFTLLDRESRRHGLPSLEDQLGRPLGPLVDPLVLDRHVDRYRPGRRTLTDACRVYGVPLRAAHDARSDALAALGVARAIAQRYPALAGMTPSSLHDLQVAAARDQAASFAAYLRRQGSTPRSVGSTWPLTPPADPEMEES